MLRGYNRKAGDNGFTLIELLIVIAIIAILAALLMPALQKGVAAARQAACGNILRQLGMLYQMYADEYHAWPANSTKVAYPWPEAIGVMDPNHEWIGSIPSKSTIVTWKRAAVCPEQPHWGPNWWNADYSDNPAFHGYGQNSYWYRGDIYYTSETRRPGLIKKPSRVINLFDYHAQVSWSVTYGTYRILQHGENAGVPTLYFDLHLSNALLPEDTVMPFSCYLDAKGLGCNLRYYVQIAGKYLDWHK